MPDRVEPLTPSQDVFSDVEFQQKSNPAGSPDSLHGRLYRDLALIEKGICDQALFPRIDIRSAMQMGSFARVKSSKQVADLTRVFADAELQTSVGFNVGTCEISLTVQLPDGAGVVKSANQAVIWTMLGVMPHQEELEAMAAAWDTDTSGQLLGNRCLEAFGKGTGAGVNLVKVCWRTRTIRLVLGVFRELQTKPAKKGLFKYGPSYITISGLGLSSHEAFEDFLVAEKQALVSKMVADTWTKLEEYPYIVGDDIRETLGERLFSYYESGIKDQRAGFEPNPAHPLSFFLYGAAGAGKSTFVSALAFALQNVIRRYLHVERRCQIVKVPLNSMTADTLNSILCVQGISDWSIERVLEQSLCKGHSIIMHFEEVPSDVEVQDRLFGAVQKMLAGLLRRYPLLGGNVIYLFTSNYEPGESMREHAVPINVAAPPVERQAGHCSKMLAEAVRGGTRAGEVAVEVDAPLPAVEDMRRLCAWWQSVGFHVSEQALALSGGEAPPRSVRARVRGSEEKELEIEVEVELAGEAAAGAAGAKATASVAVAAGRDDLLYVRREGREAGAAGWAHRMQTVVAMCRAGALTPAVAVLHGGAAGRRAVEREVQLLARGVPEEEDTRTMRVGLREEGDQVKVNGHETEIRGGLFKFIDDCNNPNVGREGGEEGAAGSAAEAGLCVVVCEVNEEGQYMLRELLEGGAQSRTHRYAINKGQVLFVISVDEGAEIQEMTKSRASAIIECR